MKRDVTGVVEALITGLSGEGKPYRLVRIQGEGYFDWDEHTSQAGVVEGDTVRLKVQPGPFPQIKSLAKIGNASEDQRTVGAAPPVKPVKTTSDPGEGRNDAAHAPPGKKGDTADSPELRLRALELAVGLLKGSSVAADQIGGEAIRVAGALLDWMGVGVARVPGGDSVAADQVKR